MQKKLLITFAIIVSIIFSFSVCFATDTLTDASNTVKDTMNNAGNAVKETMENAGNAIKDSTEKTENTMENAGNSVEKAGNTVEKDVENAISQTTTRNDDTYTTTRTSTNGSATLMGMNSTAWTWLILGIATIAIIAVVWYYSMQITSENNDSRKH